MPQVYYNAHVLPANVSYYGTCMSGHETNKLPAILPIDIVNFQVFVSMTTNPCTHWLDVQCLRGMASIIEILPLEVPPVYMARFGGRNCTAVFSNHGKYICDL